MSGIRRLAVEWGVTILVAVLAFAVFASHIAADPFVHSDSIRNLEMSQDCLAGMGCQQRLNMFGSIYHGAIFNHLLVVVGWLGGTMHTDFVVAAVGMALAVGLIGLTAWRLFGAAAGIVAAYAMLAMLAGNTPLRSSTLWNPVLLPLPSALFVVGACRYLVERRSRDLLATAGALGLGIQTHLMFTPLSMGFVVLLLAAPRGRRLWLGVASVVVVAALLALGSPTMFESFTLPDAPPSPPDWPLRIGMLAGTALVALPIGLRWRASSSRDWCLRFLLLSHAPFLCALAWVAPQAPRYLLPFMPGAIVLVVGVAAQLGERWPLALRWLPNLVVLGAVLLMTGEIVQRPDPQPRLDPTVADVEALAGALPDPPWTYDAIFRHLRGGDDLRLWLDALGEVLPVSPEGADPGLDLAVFKRLDPASSASLPPGWQRVRAVDGASVLLHAYEPWVRWDDFEVCFVARDAPDRCAWSRVRYRFAPQVALEDARRLRAAREVPRLRGMFEHEGCEQAMVLRVPLRVPAGAAARALIVRPLPGWPSRPGAIVQVSGLATPVDLPATRIDLRGAEQDQNGALTLRWDLSASCFSGNEVALPPAVLELDLASVPDAMRDDLRAPPLPPHAVSPSVEAVEPPGPVFTAPPEPLTSLTYVLAVSALLFVVLGALVFNAMRPLASGATRRTADAPPG